MSLGSFKQFQINFLQNFYQILHGKATFLYILSRIHVFKEINSAFLNT